VSASTTDTDPVLTCERDHLIRSRESLAAMRRWPSTAGDVGGDAFSSESLGAARARRLKALADDPGVPPFFGRIDRLPRRRAPSGESFHVGRRHIRDEAGDPLVIDWRAPMSRRSTGPPRPRPMGVRRRRRFGFAAGTAHLVRGRAAHRRLGRVGDARAGSCARRSSGPRVGPMRRHRRHDPARTRTTWSGPARRQHLRAGAPGTGKTAVGLHRAAYLLYTYPDRLRRSGRAGRRAEPGVPALHRRGAARAGRDRRHPDDRGRPARAGAGAGVGPARGGHAQGRRAPSPRCCAGRSAGRSAGPRDDVMLLVGTKRYRVPPHRLRRYVDDLRRSDIPYATARERLRVHVAEDVRRQRRRPAAPPRTRRPPDGPVRRPYATS
jgi:hypothetical protein